jgi:ParB-like chromosome segregation protein Spo0J
MTEPDCISALPPAPAYKGQRLNSLSKGRSETFKLDPFDLRPDRSETQNARKKFDGIPELAIDLLENGQSDPITVRRDNEGHILVVTGERRWRAAIHIRTVIAKDPEWKHVASEFLLRCQSEAPNTKPIDRLFRQLSENSGQAFTLLEKARLYQRIIDSEEGITEADIARRAQSSRQAVNQALSLVRFGAPQMLRLVEQEKISGSLAIRIIADHKDDHAAQTAAANEALGNAKAAGKGHATPKHTKRPTTFRYGKGDGEDHNEHGVFVNPPTIGIVSSPAAWLIDRFEVYLRYHGDIWCAGYDIIEHEHGISSPCSIGFPLSPTPVTEKDAWMIAFWSARSASNKLKDKWLDQIEQSFVKLLDERYPDLAITAKRPAAEAQEETRPTEEEEESDSDELFDDDAFDASEDSDEAPVTVVNGTHPRFQLYQITGAPKGHPERYRLALVNPVAPILRLHLSYGSPSGIAGAYDYGASLHLESAGLVALPIAASFHSGTSPKTALPKVLKTLLSKANLTADPRERAALDGIPDLLEQAIAVWWDLENTPDPELIPYVDPKQQDLSPADPGALARIKNAPSTNRDGTQTGAGNDGGYVSPHDRLKSLNNILEKVGDKADSDRLATAELVANYIENTTDGTTLRQHLLGK